MGHREKGDRNPKGERVCLPLAPASELPCPSARPHSLGPLSGRLHTHRAEGAQGRGSCSRIRTQESLDGAAVFK